MPVICVTCHHETSSYATKFRAGKVINSCKVCEHPPTQDRSVANPYSDLVIETVTGEDGKPLRVTSKRQLLEAEKKYHFRSTVAHMEEKNFDEIPRKPQMTISEAMTAQGKWLYPEIGPRMYAEMKARGEVQ